MSKKYPMYTVEAKSMPKEQFGYIVIRKVDNKIEISLGEDEGPFTIKEAKEIIDVLK